MIRKLLAVAALLTAGCDSPAVLANIDTYTCAYLPGAVDCSTQEVHDKAVSILTNGLVAGEVNCTGTFTRYKVQCAGYSVPEDPSSTGPATGILKYKAQKLQDGTCFVNWSAYGSGDVGFIARSNAYASACEIDIASDIHVTASNNEVVVHSSQVSYRLQGNPTLGCVPYTTPDTVFDMHTQCAGFNFEAFDTP